MVPTCGLTDQVTAVAASPVTAAENCCFCPARIETLAGVTAMAAGTGDSSVICAEPVLEPSATLVAVTVTVLLTAIDAGAV